jgi:hypothetical protein
MPDTAPARRPAAVPLNFVFIKDAVLRLGLAKHGDDWQTILAEWSKAAKEGKAVERGEVDGRAKAFDAILITLGEACEAGTVAAVYEWSAGDLERLEPAHWHVPHWRDHILFGRVPIARAMEPHSAWEPPDVEERLCWIFVRAGDIVQLEAGLKAEHGTKGKGTPGRRRSKKKTFEKEDRRLFSDLRRVMKEKHLAAHGAALLIADRIAGYGSLSNKAKRLATLYLSKKPKQN